MAQSSGLGDRRQAFTNERGHFLSDLLRFVQMYRHHDPGLTQPGAVVPRHLRELCVALHSAAIFCGYADLRSQLERWSAMACQPAPLPLEGLRETVDTIERLTVNARRALAALPRLEPAADAKDDSAQAGGEAPAPAKPPAEGGRRGLFGFRKAAKPSASPMAPAPRLLQLSLSDIDSFFDRLDRSSIFTGDVDKEARSATFPDIGVATVHRPKLRRWWTAGILGLAVLSSAAFLWSRQGRKASEDVLLSPAPAASFKELGIANPAAAPAASEPVRIGGDVSPEFRDYLQQVAKREKDFCDSNPGICKKDVVPSPVPPSPRVSILEGVNMPSGFPIPHDDVLVQQWYSLYVEKPYGREQMQANLFRCSAYREDIEAALLRFGLPKAVMAVVFVESGCDNTGISRAGAKGIWQFMPDLARAYGLHVIDNVIDERLNPTKLTQVAVKFLADLYRQFGSWDLALAAYNVGPYGLMGRMRRWGSDATFSKLANAGWLPSETADYVPHIQALAVILENARALKFIYQVKSPIDTGDLVVPAGTRVSLIARAAATSTLRIHELNRDILRATVPDAPGQYIVQVPRNVQLQAQHTLRELVDAKADEDRCVEAGFDWGKQLFTSQMKAKCDSLRSAGWQASRRP